MATEALKSTPVTNLDASPVVRMSPGEGGHAVMRWADGSVTGTTGVTVGSTYQMVRVSTRAVIKQIWAWLDAAVTTFTADIGIYYSSSTTDGTPSANRGTVVSGDQAFFASAVAFASAVTQTEYSTESGTYTGAKRAQPLWQAAGLSSDPGGYFDIVATTTATTSGAPVLNMLVAYIDPGS